MQPPLFSIRGLRALTGEDANAPPLSCSVPIDRWHILLIESANCNACREAGEASIDRRNRRRTKE